MAAAQLRMVESWAYLQGLRRECDVLCICVFVFAPCKMLLAPRRLAFLSSAPMRQGWCLGAQGLLVVERQIERSAPAERWVPAVEGWELSKG
jgi:hypothetical protein